VLSPTIQLLYKTKDFSLPLLHAETKTRSIGLELMNGVIADKKLAPRSRKSVVPGSAARQGKSLPISSV